MGGNIPKYREGDKQERIRKLDIPMGYRVPGNVELIGVGKESGQPEKVVL
jgi:hypothetical protein